jgi:hypothetical protein
MGKESDKFPSLGNIAGFNKAGYSSRDFIL